MLISDLQCVILVGGLGTRLRSVLPEIPKSLASIDGKPFLEYQIEWLKKQGINRFVLCTGYRADMLKNHFQSGSKWGVSIVYSHETKPLGTAGALKLAENFLSKRFLLTNGDTFCYVTLSDLINTHIKNKACLTLSIAESKNSDNYGNIITNDLGEIIYYAEKKVPGGDDISERRSVNAGYYLAEKSILQYIPKNKRYSLEKDLLPYLLTLKKTVMTFLCDKFWDIGTPERLKKFEHMVRNSKVHI